MAKLKIKFHLSFWIFAILLIYFNLFELLLSMVTSVIIHELGHYFVASKLGYKLTTLNLMPYGAFLSGEDIFIDSKHEIYIAMAGPLLSLFVATIVVALWRVFPSLYQYSQTFVYANLSLFMVNLLPCFPLDGARVLCAVLKQKNTTEKSYRIIKTVSIATVIILFIFYFISIFNEPNYTLCIFVIFLTVGIIFNDDTEKYKLKSRTFCGKNTSKGIAVNIKAISDKSNVLEMYKLLKPSAINYILVLDKMNNTLVTLSDNDIKTILDTYPLDTPLCKIKVTDK